MKNYEHYDENNFTALRLLLALLVVLGHFQLFAGIAAPPWPFNYAMAAVDCFFVVSGYLVTNSFDHDSNLWRFYIRRFFRIYPLYIAVVVVQTIGLGFLDPAGPFADGGSLLRYFVVNATFANFLQHDVGQGALTSLVDPNLNPSLWTLKIEFGFYLILPVLWHGVRRFGAGLLVLVFALSAIYYITLDVAGNYQLAKQLPGQLQFFVLGIGAYRYRDRFRFSRATGVWLTIALSLLFTALLRPHPAVLYPLVVGAVTMVAALRTPPLRLRTDISYGVYLLHAPLIQLSLLFGIYRPGSLGLSATIGATLVLAAIAERLIEAPGIALGRRLSQRIRNAAPRGAHPDRSSAAESPSPSAPSASRSPSISDGGLTVVVLNDFCHVQGGASKVAIDEAISLARAGVNVVFLGAVGPVCAELAHAPLTVECLGQRELSDVARHPSVAFQGLWNAKASRWMARILRTLPRDRTIIHLHGYTKALTISPVRVARRLGFTAICTLHDFFAACPNGAFFDYAKERPCTRHALSPACIFAQCDKRHYMHKAFRVARGLMQRGLGGFPGDIHHYISLSERSAAILGPYLPPQAHVHRLPNITDVARRPPVPVGQNRTLLCVGRLDVEKGVKLLADTVRQMGLAVKFVGDGPLRAEIETVPGVSVTGWLSRDEIQRHLASARCLVFPSLWYETYGLSVAEAAALGIPAIVSDISAAAERVQEGVSGWRFRSGDASDLARCLRRIEDDDLVRQAGGAAYRAFWRNAATSDTHADSLIRIYRSALQH